ncbi:MAG: hypothetical protein ACKO1W_15445, partial [Microcystaceae cyanobacterium]
LDELDEYSWIIKSIALGRIYLLIEAIQCLSKAQFIASKYNIKREPSALDGIKSLGQIILIFIFNNSTQVEAWLKDSQLILEIYAQHNLLDNLSGGLFESIKAINEPSTSDHTAQAWLKMWQNLAGDYPEFQVALNLLRVAVEYKIQKDKRVLFQLPKEERQILEELLNPV